MQVYKAVFRVVVGAQSKWLLSVTDLFRLVEVRGSGTPVCGSGEYDEEWSWENIERNTLSASEWI